MTILIFAVSRADDRTDVQRALDQFIVAFNNLDWNSFRAALADDITVFNPDIPEAPSIHRLDGRKQVEDGFNSVFEVTRQHASGPPYLHIAPRNIQTQIYGETAVVTFEFDRENHSIGRRTLVFHREAGAWKIVHIHASNVAQRE